MKTRLLHLWDKLSTSYWFVPAFMLVVASGLAFAMLQADEHLLQGEDEWQWVYSGGPEGARILLSTVAGSVITVAGVVFSVTIATLTQASSQYGPRLLRNFMRDTGNQVVLGTFVATFLYCVLILRTIASGESAPVPQLSVMVAFLLAVASLCVLVFFIHHVSFSIQAPLVVARAWEELCASVTRVFPEGFGHGGPAPEGMPSPEAVDAGEPVPQEAFAGEWRAVFAGESGYIQVIDAEGLMTLAETHDLRLKLEHRPGKFVIEGGLLATVWPAATVTEDVATEIREAFLIGRYRTPEQDMEFAINQIVEIAVRSLSPGINDPLTAVTCIDWLGDALCRIAKADLLSPYRYDERGVLRAVTGLSSFTGVVNAAFDEIRQYGQTSVPVNIRLLETITAVAEQLKSDAQRTPLRRQADIIHRQSTATLQDVADQADVEQRYRRALAALRVTAKGAGVSGDTNTVPPDPQA